MDNHVRDIIVADVMQVFVSAKALRYAPGAAYVIEGRKSDGGDDGRGGKRARVPPSHGRAFSSDEDGDGPVQPAIDSIQEDALRAYAEQQVQFVSDGTFICLTTIWALCFILEKGNSNLILENVGMTSCRVTRCLDGERARAPKGRRSGLTPFGARRGAGAEGSRSG